MYTRKPFTVQQRFCASSFCAELWFVPSNPSCWVFVCSNSLEPRCSNGLLLTSIFSHSYNYRIEQYTPLFYESCTALLRESLISLGINTALFLVNQHRWVDTRGCAAVVVAVLVNERTVSERVATKKHQSISINKPNQTKHSHQTPTKHQK